MGQGQSMPGLPAALRRFAGWLSQAATVTITREPTHRVAHGFARNPIDAPPACVAYQPCASGWLRRTRKADESDGLPDCRRRAHGGFLPVPRRGVEAVPVADVGRRQAGAPP